LTLIVAPLYLRDMKTLLFVAAFIAAAQGPKITDGRSLLRAMHDKYGGKWFHTAVFVQDNTNYGPDGAVSGHNQWDHHFSLPGKLRIDFLPLTDGNGVLLRNDSQYVFQKNQLTGKSPRLFSLLLLAFDAYLLPPDTTIARIERLKFDLSQLHEEQWQGRPVYVAGAKAGDLKSRQFWVDKENLYPVRVIEPVDSVHVRDVQFNKYRRLGDGWIAPEVMMYQDGKPQRLEEYRDPKEVPVDQKLFDPGNWKR
jgi:hypothetical protein